MVWVILVVSSCLVSVVLVALAALFALVALVVLDQIKLGRWKIKIQTGRVGRSGVKASPSGNISQASLWESC